MIILFHQLNSLISKQEKILYEPYSPMSEIHHPMLNNPLTTRVGVQASFPLKMHNCAMAF